MHRNTAWRGFLFLILGITLYFTFFAVRDLYTYSRLSLSVPIDTLTWEVLQIDTDHYVLMSEYTFTFQNKEYHHKKKHSHPTIRNFWTASKRLETFRKRPWRVWIDPQDPNVSSLEKVFPSKACFQGGVMILLLVYFTGLGYYVAKKQT